MTVLVAHNLPPIESLDKKIQVPEMRLETGANCPHASTSRRVNTRYIYASFCCRSWYKTSFIPRPPFNTDGGGVISRLGTKHEVKDQYVYKQLKLS